MTPRRFVLISLTTGCSLLSHTAAAPEIVPAGSKVELVARAEAAQATPFTEGPAYRNGHIYFTDTSNSRILRVRVDRQAALPLSLEIFREPSGRANGLEFDLAGRLLACEGSRTGGGRRVTRTESSGALTALAEKYQGKRLNSPNDLTVDAQGRIYFTDPRYGNRAGIEPDKESVSNRSFQRARARHRGRRASQWYCRFSGPEDALRRGQ